MAVHPRVGGEHARLALSLRVYAGSSPRGRGTRIEEIKGGDISRFIPAWAGNTSSLISRSPVSAVHPRVGGEHDAAKARDLHLIGSSPRGRGTRISSFLKALQIRFIPAWAGNTNYRTAPRSRRPVHPRVGGEHSSWNPLIQKVYSESIEVTGFFGTWFKTSVMALSGSSLFARPFPS